MIDFVIVAIFLASLALYFVAWVRVVVRAFR